MTGRFHLGTSGFAYQEWKGVFYPEDVKSDGMLGYYASKFPSVEINYTFRRHPADKTLERWAADTPEDFRFTLKAHGRITHTKRLRDADEPVSMFLERARLLGPKLGTILFQCPPTLPYEEGLLEKFLGFLPGDVRAAFEFRHPSWVAAKSLLVEQGAAWCTAETDEQPAGEPVFEPFGYLRLRKEVYTDEELSSWASRISEALASGRDVYCYLKHEEKGAGPVYAARLKEFIDGRA